MSLQEHTDQNIHVLLIMMIISTLVPYTYSLFGCNRIISYKLGTRCCTGNQKGTISQKDTVSSCPARHCIISILSTLPASPSPPPHTHSHPLIGPSLLSTLPGHAPSKREGQTFLCYIFYMIETICVNSMTSIHSPI